MRLFNRIFINHVLIVFVVCTLFAAAAKIIAPTLYQGHLNYVLLALPLHWKWLPLMLEQAKQHVIMYSLLVSLPLAALIATATARLGTQRITAMVRQLAEESRELARGHYGHRVEIQGTEELTEIGRHFNQLAEALEQADHQRAAMVGVVAHEIKTPLSNLRAYAEALADGVLPPEEVSRIIMREMSILNRITDDLLLVSRVEAGQIALQLAPQRPEVLLVDAQERFTPVFQDKGIVLETSTAERLPTVSGDRERIGQVLGALLANAHYHTPQGGCVTLTVQANEGAALFSVDDNGPGILEHHQPYLFERFYQADAASNRRDRKLGIGLTVARGLVEAMGGRIWVESKGGQGSTFFFTIPFANTLMDRRNLPPRLGERPRADPDLVDKL